MTEANGLLWLPVALPAMVCSGHLLISLMARVRSGRFPVLMLTVSAAVLPMTDSRFPEIRHCRKRAAPAWCSSTFTTKLFHSKILRFSLWATASEEKMWNWKRSERNILRRLRLTAISGCMLPVHTMTVTGTAWNSAYQAPSYVTAVSVLNLPRPLSLPVCRWR